MLFTALHGMQTRSSDEISVCPSVCQTRALWQNGRKICPDFLPCERTSSLVLWEKEWLVGATPSILNIGSTGPLWSEIADFEPIIARSASAVRPSEKSSINTNKKSRTRFPMSLRWSSYVAPNSPKGGSKTQIGRFSSKFALRLKKVCYKVSLCENCERHSRTAFIDLTIHAKIIGGGLPLLPEILSQNVHVGEKSPIFDLFSLIAAIKFLSVKTVSDRVVRHSLA